MHAGLVYKKLLTHFPPYHDAVHCANVHEQDKVDAVPAWTITHPTQPTAAGEAAAVTTGKEGAGRAAGGGPALGTGQAVPATTGHGGEQGERLPALSPQAILQVGGWDKAVIGHHTVPPWLAVAS